MFCENCGKSIDDNCNYCSNCGTKVKKDVERCSNCGAEVKAEDSVCDNCGYKINRKEYGNGNDDKTYSSYSDAYNQIYNGGQGKGETYPRYNESPARRRQKSKVVAGVLGILLGGLGVHRFYLGYIGIGIIQVVLSILTFGMASLWGFIEGILILCGTGITTDADGAPLSDN